MVHTPTVTKVVGVFVRFHCAASFDSNGQLKWKKESGFDAWKNRSTR
jgi:hypothetical protein